VERLPEGWIRTVQDGIEIAARRESLDIVNGALRTAGSLHAYAAAQPGALPLQGRGTAWAFPADDGWWVVRRARRGGAMQFLGDRHLRRGQPRPYRELGVSELARARGIDTPPLLAIAIHPAGLFYRADIATRFITNSADLAALTLGDHAWTAELRQAAWAAAGTLLRTVFDRGLLHPDLNLRNILIARETGGLRAWLLDLDRCRIMQRVTRTARAQTLRRFHRSRRKIEHAAGRSVAEDELRAFARALGD
jgi:hypothetical protein